MHVTLVANYGWWPLSDPLITFLKYFRKLKIPCTILGAFMCDFLPEKFPSEPEFSEAHVIIVKKEWGFAYYILREQLLHIREKHIIIYFDNQSFLASYHLAGRFASAVYLYSTEIPERAPASCKISDILNNNKVKFVIQDEDRLKLFERTFSAKISKPVIMANSNLLNYDYELVKPKGINFPESGRVITLTGTLQSEHCVLEMVKMFIEAKKNFFLFINGWIPDAKYKSELKTLTSGQENIILSTKVLSGAEMRWIYAYCYAGIVSYSNRTNNHKFTGMSSGKLFWLCRYGKPIICNDNLSISNIVEFYNLGIKTISGKNLDYLENNYSRFSNNCKTFYNIYASDTINKLQGLLI